MAWDTLRSRLPRASCPTPSRRTGLATRSGCRRVTAADPQRGARADQPRRRAGPPVAPPSVTASEQQEPVDPRAAHRPLPRPTRRAARRRSRSRAARPSSSPASSTSPPAPSSPDSSPHSSEGSRSSASASPEPSSPPAAPSAPRCARGRRRVCRLRPKREALLGRLQLSWAATASGPSSPSTTRSSRPSSPTFWRRAAARSATRCSRAVRRCTST